MDLYIILLRNSLRPVGKRETNNIIHRQHTRIIVYILGIGTSYVHYNRYVFYFVFSSIYVMFSETGSRTAVLILPYQLALKFAAPTTSRIFPCNYYYYYIKTHPFYDSRSYCVYRVVRGRKNYNALRRNSFLCVRL